MVLCTRVNLKTEWKKAKVNYSIQMVINMLERGKMIWQMDMACSPATTECTDMKEHGTKISNKSYEKYYGSLLKGFKR